MQKRELPAGWDTDIPSFAADPKGLATRDSSGKVLNAIARHVPWLIGGSADLSPSTKTNLTFEAAGDFEAEKYGGRNLHFGIREHAMGAILNGLLLSKIHAYGSTFLNFSDYMKAAIRLSALMELPVIYIFTHDSIGLGEDGPTHQPIEQLVALRSIPGLITLRPADANEVAEAWRVIIGLEHQPSCLVLTRQPLPTFDRKRFASAAGVARGAYVMADAERANPAVILMGTGSEVALCVEAYEALKQEGIKARVAVEAGSVIGWDRYVGATGTRIGMHTFGASAPIKDVMARFGFTREKVLAAAKQQLGLAKEKAA
jgi:transketolase